MTIPEFRESLERYKEGCQPGSFMEALLSNNLMGAVAYADPSCASNLAEFVLITNNTLPGGIWGSPERVHAHLANKRTETEEAQG